MEAVRSSETQMKQASSKVDFFTHSSTVKMAAARSSETLVKEAI
jgi:hypothetical protein